ncbi:hypothetical protein N7456_009775 [Penicillium angulare]|uniref:Uncharacterized protein n=1 Tax=Penicillium angulare TaxID=116970 RepID=A0A9W9K5J9_9EURO|nr:hypothetical protein N7456_009775 [Penicillium angulare]
MTSEQVRSLIILSQSQVSVSVSRPKFDISGGTNSGDLDIGVLIERSHQFVGSDGDSTNKRQATDNAPYAMFPGFDNLTNTARL